MAWLVSKQVRNKRPHLLSPFSAEPHPPCGLPSPSPQSLALPRRLPGFVPTFLCPAHSPQKCCSQPAGAGWQCGLRGGTSVELQGPRTNALCISRPPGSGHGPALTASHPKTPGLFSHLFSSLGSSIHQAQAGQETGGAFLLK